MTDIELITPRKPCNDIEYMRKYFKRLNLTLRFTDDDPYMYVEFIRDGEVIATHSGVPHGPQDYIKNLKNIENIEELFT